MHWILLTNEPHVELIMERLYFYRLRKESLMGQRGEYPTRCGPTFSLIKNHLRNMGRYEQYRDLLLKRKFSGFLNGCNFVQKRNLPDAVRRFLESLDDEEIDFLRNSGTINSHNRDTILYLLGDQSLYWKCVWHTINSRYLKKMTKPIEKSVKFFREKSILERESRIRELSEQLAWRDQIIVRLRNHQDSPELRVVGFRQSFQSVNKINVGHQCPEHQLPPERKTS